MTAAAEATGAMISEMLGQGRSLQVIVARSGWSLYEVRQIADANGYNFSKDGAPHKRVTKTARASGSPHEALQRMYDDEETAAKAFVPSPAPEPEDSLVEGDGLLTIPTSEGLVTIADKVTVDQATVGLPSATPEHPQVTVTVPLSASAPITDLLAAGLGSPVTRIRNLAQRTHGLLTDLRKQVADYEAACAAAAEKDRLATEARAKVDRLEAELRAARAALRGTPPPTGDPRPHLSAASAQARAESHKIRDWARANGHDVAVRGSIPTVVRNAYNPAHPVP